MLYPGLVSRIIQNIRLHNRMADLIMYTADCSQPTWLLDLLFRLDGLTVTLHEQSDILPFITFTKIVGESEVLARLPDKSLRVNIFDGIDLPSIPDIWKVKSGIRWIKNCPLPPGEVLMRL